MNKKREKNIESQNTFKDNNRNILTDYLIGKYKYILRAFLFLNKNLSIYILFLTSNT